MSQDVLLNRPNLIGYTRLILFFIAIFYEDLIFISLYLMSVSLDYFDGKIARLYNETSELGACLDMITDRLSTAMLCMKIVRTKPHLTKKCMSFVFIDVLRHFLYFISMIYYKIPHKTFTANPFLKIYYHDITLKILCSGTELYFIALYYSKKDNKALTYLSTLPAIKTFFHLVHLWYRVSILSDVPKK